MSVVSLLSRLKQLDIGIRLIDDQLKISAPGGRLTPDLLNELKKQKREIVAFLRNVQMEGGYTSIEPVEKKEYYALSSVQKRLYLLRQMEPDNIAYNMPMNVPLDSQPDKETLESLLKRLIARHESFRTSFRLVNGEPVQRIHNACDVPFEIECCDLATGDTENTGGKIFVRPFDLSRVPLLRSWLIKEAGNGWTWIIDMHHIISDGTSQEVLNREFMGLTAGWELSPLKLQYKDFSEWQNSEEQKAILAKQGEYWLEQFQGELPVLDLPMDYPRPVVQSFEGSTVGFTMAAKETRQLMDTAEKYDATLFMLLLAIYNVLLHKLGRQEDIIVGTPIAGRRHARVQNIIGMFINTLAMRNYPNGEKSFPGFLKEVKRHTIAAYENQDYPFEELVENAAVARDAGRNPVFDVLFHLLNQSEYKQKHRAGEEVPTGQEQSFIHQPGTAKFDLNFAAVQVGDRLRFSVEYCTKLFKPESIERFIRYFKKVIAVLIENPELRLEDIDILSQEEKKQLLFDFNDRYDDAGFPTGTAVHELFERQAQKWPDRTAVVETHQLHEGKNIALTYRELNKQSEQMGHLLKQKGVIHDTIVGIMAERSVETVTGILAILKAGGAYLPLDPDYPGERIDYMLEDSSASILITSTGLSSRALDSSEGRPFPLPPAARNLHLSLAYVIYTSGTTGKPKGSLITHRNVVRLMFNDNYLFDFSEKDVWTLFHSFCFDFSVWEMYGALLYGGKLVVTAKMAARDTRRFLQILKEQRVTVLNQTPKAFYNLVDLEMQRPAKALQLGYVIFGGDALAPAKLKEWKEKYPNTKLINMFGITETTVHVTYKEITDSDIRLNVSNIGGPIPTLSVYILDLHLHLAPPGAAGELCVAGEGVCRGYLNRPELTAKRFCLRRPGGLFLKKPPPWTPRKNFLLVRQKFCGGAGGGFSKEPPARRRHKLYKSGDLARWLLVGELEYLGRIDHQVKIRGFRVELGEIETRLLNHGSVKEAVVLAKAKDEGNLYLCAYVVAGSPLDVLELKEYLAVHLPEYMVPSYIVLLDGIPLTANGKVDRKALPEPERSGADDYVPPGNEIEQKIAETWKKVLALEKVGIRDNYFNVGGDSIKAIKLLSLINAQFQSDLKIVDLFTGGTIEELARKIGTSLEGLDLSEARREVAELKNRILASDGLPWQGSDIEDIYPMSDIEKGMVFHGLKEQRRAVYHDQMVHRLRYVDFDAQRLKKALALMVEKHPVLRTGFHMGEYEEPVQVVHRKNRLDFRHEDIAHMPGEGQQRYIMEAIAADRRSPIDVTEPPLWRMRTFALDKDNIVVLWVCHHAIIDGWSDASFKTELNNIYLALKTDPGFVPQKLKSSYKEFILEQIAWKKKPGIPAYWQNELDGYKRFDFPGPGGTDPDRETAGMKSFVADLGRPLWERLNRLAKTLQTNLKHLCFGAYIYILTMLSYENDITTGLVTNNRPVCEDGEKILGCFLNTVPVRVKIPAGITWSGYIRLIEEKLARLAGYDRLSLFEIVKITGEESRDQNPIFDILFNFIDFHVFREIDADPDRAGIEKSTRRGQPHRHDTDGANGLQVKGQVNANTLFDFSIDTTLGGFFIGLSYAASLLDEEMVQKYCGFYKKILEIFVREPEGLMSKDKIIAPAEKRRLLYEFNDTRTAYPSDRTIPALFEEQTSKKPDNIALVGFEEEEKKKDISVTYNELDRRANRLAHLLIKRGVGPDTIVGLMVERSLEMIVGILGILKAGGAYMPIDPGYPQERVDYMLKDSGAGVLVTGDTLVQEDRGDASPFPGCPASRSSHLAYVIYTSGTTGRPKGTLTTHYNVIRVVRDTNYIDLTVRDRVLQLSNYAFDGSVFDIYGALLNGAALVMAGREDVLSVDKLSGLLEREAVTVFFVTTALFNTLVDINIHCLAGIRKVLFGGERVSVAHAKKALACLGRDRIIHVYGPTETTVYATYYNINEITETMGTIPIGRPIANTTIAILDRNLHLAPIGGFGEIYIGGDGTARGYLNNLELTAEKFLTAKTREGTRRIFYMSHTSYMSYNTLYKTGDLARWLPDGSIEFSGRIDQQVKIRGFRIEPGEIQALLLHHEKIKDAVVIAKGSFAEKDKYIIAYIVPGKGFSASAEIKEYLVEKLPAYMVPAYFVEIEKIPLTANGKIDRRALPAPGLGQTGVTYRAPRDETEKKLALLWSEVLNLPYSAVGIADNFFERGGHSLKATILVSRIQKTFKVKFPLGEIFRIPFIEAQARTIEKAVKEKYFSVEPAEKKEYYALSSAQKRLYLLQQLTPASTAYNLPMHIPLDTEIDKEKLESLLKRLIHRHESLRTSFHMLAEEPVQAIHEEVEFQLENKAPAAQPFDLSKAPLLRSCLIEGPGSRRVWFIDMHHIVTDGTSQGLLTNEFMRLFAGEDLEPLKLQYKDFSQWQNGKGQKEAVGKQEEYWLQVFTGEVPVIELPMDYPRPAEQDFAGNTVHFSLAKEETRKLKNMASQCDATLYMVLLSIFNVLLSRLGGGEDIIVGTPIAGRRHDELQGIVGMFVNTLAMRNYPSGEKSFAEFLKEVKGHTIAAYENQDYPFEDLVEKVEVARDTGRNPVFDVLFNLLNQSEYQGEVPGDDGGQTYIHRPGTAKFDLSLTAVEMGERLVFTVEYCTALFKPGTIERFIDYFKKAVSLVDEGAIPLAKIEIIPGDEKKRLLVEFNDTDMPYPADKTVQRLFEEQTARTGDRVAVMGRAHSAWLSYKELNIQSGGLAYLLKEKGIKPGTIAGIMLERSIEMMVAILGILKAGGAYLPIDPDYPEERVNYMLKDSNAAILLAAGEKGDMQIKSPPGRGAPKGRGGSGPANCPAYLLYTSGSTGKPKGVAVEHGSLINILWYLSEEYPFSRDDNYLLKTSVTFDVSLTELFGWFIGKENNGGRLTILKPGAEKDPLAILETIERSRITHVNFVPSMFNAFTSILDHRNIHRLSGLKYIFLAGEALWSGLVTAFKGLASHIDVKLENLYGPTEATIYASGYSLQEWQENNNIPIGKPLGNVQLYILNKYDGLQATGVPGELVIAGTGLARGYLNNPGLTAENFCFNKKFLWGPGAVFSKRAPGRRRQYKTGDLARWLEDGNIEFLGRMDHQVKIRGFRIELGEIQSLLLHHDRIEDAAVTVLELKEDKAICAYIVPGKEFSVLEVKEYLSGKLPAYMIPAYFVEIEKVPLNASGKVDGKALAGFQISNFKSQNGYIAPRSETEKKLAALWSELLSVPYTSIGIADNFFNLGGHSLKATILAAKIRKTLNVTVSLAAIFRMPFIREQARYINEAVKEKYFSVEPAEKKEYYALSSAQKRLYFLQQLTPESTAYNLPMHIPFDAEIEKEQLASLLKRLIARHESLRTSFHMLGEEPVQGIHEEVEFELENKMPAPALALRAFDLAKAPLLRSCLIEGPGSRRVWFIDMHHIITDGVSQALLTAECMRLFAGEGLPPLKFQYKDFSEWQNSEEQEAALTRQEEYWLEIFAGEVPVIELPIDYPRPAVQDFAGYTVQFSLAEEETRELKNMAGQCDATLYMVLLSIFNVLLSKLGGGEDIIVGTPIAGRRHDELQGIVGMFVNTLAMRNFPCGEKSFHEFLAEVKRHTIDAYENQDYPFEDLVEKVEIARDTGRNPVFDVVFNFLNQSEYKGEITGDEEEGPYIHRPGTAKFDLNLTAVEMGERLVFAVEYAGALFKPAAIERFIGYFKQAVSLVHDKPGMTLADIEIISQEEKKRLLVEFNDAEAVYPVDKTIHGLFEEQTEKRPDITSVNGMAFNVGADPRVRPKTGEQVQITYRELNKRSDRLAWALGEKGVKPGTIVGIMLERSIEMMVAILGILKAGGAYLPIGPDYPEERVNYMLRDSSAAILLAAGEKGDMQINSPPGRGAPKGRGGSGPANRLAYIIYTSGSTGRPRGVPIPHFNLSPLLHWGYLRLGLGPADRVIQNLAYYFDWSVWEIFITLTTGASLYLTSDEILLDPSACIAFMNKHDITALHVTPSRCRYFVDAGCRQETLKYLFIGAETLPLDLLRRSVQWAGNGCRVFNMYGPTECTIIASVLEIEPEQSDPDIGKFKGLSSIPIGRPVGNTALLVLDKQLAPCPLNVSGELYITGDGLAPGYLNNPELTAEKFCLRRAGGSFEKPPPAPPQNFCFKKFLRGVQGGGFFKKSPPARRRQYKTGDLARWLSDGNIEFLGRMDHQVKIRGFRIELEEIQSLLLQHEKIKDAAVIVRGVEDDRAICACIVPGKEFSAAEVKEYLSGKLPGYMIPSYFIEIEKIPLNANGKVDRKALAGLQISDVKLQQESAAPRNETEKKLALLWSEVLNVPHASIGIADNFFNLGGHSLKATILAAKIRKTLNVPVSLAAIFRMPFIGEQARYINEAVKEKYFSVEPAEKKGYYALSSAQKRLYFLQQLTPASTAYNLSMHIPFDIEIDKGKLESLLKRLIARHESLRTSFHLLGEEPVQVIHEEVEFELEDKMPAPALALRAFDLAKAPLLRSCLIEGPGSRRVWFIDMHHIITDGTSQALLTAEFMRLFAAEDLEPLKFQYKDFSEWQNSEEQEAAVIRQEEYWLEVFPGDVPVIELPIDYPRPAVQDFAGYTVQFSLAIEETRQLKNMAKQCDATLYMVLLSIYNILLSKLGGGEDIIIGTPIAGRRHDELQGIVGMFVNTLAMRNFPSGEKSFHEFLAEVKRHTVAAYENQDYPFEDLVEKVDIARDTGRNPIFDVLFNLLNQSEYKGEIPGDEDQRSYRHQPGIVKFDLNLTVVEMGERLVFAVEYAAALFKPATIERFIGYFKKVVSLVHDKPGMNLADIEIIPGDEKKRLLVEFNDTEMAYPVDKTTHGLFEEQAARTGNVVAVMAQGNTAITYDLLNKKSNQLAWALGKKGVTTGTIVGIMLERSIEMMAAILGILKAGGAYLPIDPDYPQDRIDYMLKDSGTQILLTPGKLSNGNGSLRSSPLTLHPSPLTSPAYIIYTSGSTGKPKGVTVEHGSLINILWYLSEEYPFSRDDNYLLKTSVVFDVSLTELFGWFIGKENNGGRLTILEPGAEKDPLAILETIERSRITHVNFVPSMFNAFTGILDHRNIHRLSGLKYIFLAGEALWPGLVTAFKGLAAHCGVKLENLYGPTEATIYASGYSLQEWQENKNIPIGKPLGNVQLYILNKYDGLQATGVPGELIIAGTGLARGYLNNPELTAERFCLRRPGGSFEKLPPGPPQNLCLTNKKFLWGVQGGGFFKKSPPGRRRQYKTGDLARWLVDGNIEFLGRMDHQVKIRGFRIELGEIQSLLLRHEKIKDAAVTVRELNDDKSICAYIVPGKEFSAIEVKEYLSGKLPGYMIPSYFTEIEKIPLTANGKVDRKALAGVQISDLKLKNDYTAPRNETEEKLAALWSELLSVSYTSIGIDDHFFNLGGHSLKATAMVSRVHRRLGVRVPVAAVFKAPTIRLLAGYIDRAEKESESVMVTDDRLVLLKKVSTGAPAPLLFFIHDGSGEVEGYNEFCRCLTAPFNCWGIRADGPDEYAPRDLSIEEIAAGYIEKIEKIQPGGPYRIVGWSMGGTIAFEMARQLEGNAAFLALIDTVAPHRELAKAAVEFTLESEQAFIGKYLPGIETGDNTAKAGGIKQLWSWVVDYLETNRIDPEIIKKVLADYEALVVPGKDRLSTGELIKYLNTARTLRNARARYMPAGTIAAPVHYFAAAESAAKRLMDEQLWRQSCSEITYYTVPGDHFSIFKPPHAAALAKIFEQTLKDRPL